MITIDAGRLTIERSGIGGWHGIAFGLNGCTTAGRPTTLETHDDGIAAVIDMDAWQEHLHVAADEAAGRAVVTRTVRNTGDVPLTLSEIVDGRLDADTRIEWDGIHEYTVRYVHSRNVRTEAYPRSRPQYPFVRPIPYEPVQLNAGEGNHVPAFILTDETYRVALVEGDLNQTRFVRDWELGLQGEGEHASPLIRTCRGVQRLPLAAAPCTLAPGEQAAVSCVFYQILSNTHPQDALADYIEELTRRHTFRGPQSAMRHGAVFCTWNYGTLSNIDETLLATRAAALAKRVPHCTHFLIDDGYQQERGNRNGPLDCFYPDPPNRWDRAKFPSGMRAMADRIRDCGLTPCIWLSPAVYLQSRLAEAHPDWLLCDAQGRSGLLGRSTFLDLSVDEARAFYLAVLDALFLDWGFRGIKFDFMTQWFTLDAARFRNGGSGPEWRDWAFGEIRKRIGDDGLFMTCIAMTMGNPFQGLNADCYRCGNDIHDGTWPEQYRACKATLPQILLEGRKTYLLNMDSAGFGTVPENEQLFRLTWVFITQGILELGGPVESMPDRQIEQWNRMLAHVDRGHKVRCLDERAFTGNGLPEILKVDYPEDSRTFSRGVRAHLALFNWEEGTKPVGGTRAAFGIAPEAPIADFWTGEPCPPADMVADNLPPHSARLFEIGA